MKINFKITLELENSDWDLFCVEKELELSFIPNIGDVIADNGLHFKVESRKFNILDEYLTIYLQDYKLINDNNKKDVLKRMEDSGWYYRDPAVYTLSKL
ncbi:MULTISPECIES: hypothetical protein [Methanobacterium]|jgi:hypothetical protein|uniref:Uncharacterized protein n=1 Tax=Methanobacterium bryantii TaxID=2161 RepID=A0A2A2H3R6_METBR|nr:MULTISPECIES: hypothetical protein [Methanobacterium]OEC86754.1 hypothetical protein A9507_09910 [Methanobacterium sp. A39]PAV04032.1 hypothetical protein ASJ80_03185 [Methanobacterium bryantii]